MDKEKVRKAVEMYKKGVYNSTLSQYNSSKNILTELAEKYLAGELVEPMTQDEIVDIIHESELCKVANKNTSWQVRRSRKNNLAEALCGIVPKRFESMTQIEIRDLCHTLICKRKLPIDEEATVVGISIEIAETLCKIGKEKK